MDKPLLIVGMHRSGTTLLARILDKIGVFMGRDLDQNHESKFFQQLNRWIFRQLGGRWDNPPDFDQLWSSEEVWRLMRDYLNYRIDSYEMVKYAGLKRYFKLRGMFGNSINGWGWKDPRNVFTLPVWLSVFPKAKIIYIERHGVDVANSLNNRSKRLLEERKQIIRNPSKFNRSRKEYVNVTDSIRCFTLEGAFSLWEEYIESGRNNIKQTKDTELLQIRYEDLLLNADKWVKTISEFVKKEIDYKTVINISDSIKSNRAFAYKKKPELKKFAHQVSDRLNKYNV